ncbi:hypothetical protein CRYUN_Cryun12cG0139100 [Craigia yunnanensis]
MAFQKFSTISLCRTISLVEIPNLDFSNLLQFNVSHNNFSGPLPDVKGNPELCGELLSKACPPSPPSTGKSKDSSSKQFLIYSEAKKKNEADVAKKGVEANTSSNKTSSTSNEFKTTENKSEYSISSVECGVALSSLVVLTSPTAQCLRFEDLLRAPAELLGKGKH